MEIRPAAVYQRVGQAGHVTPLDERVLEDTDTLPVFGLVFGPAHLVTG
ncbi:hypothetical protein [Dactylosporangium sp. NPDC006015]